MPASDSNPYGLDTLPFDEPDLQDSRDLQESITELFSSAGWAMFEQIIERVNAGDPNGDEDLEDAVLDVLEDGDLPVWPVRDDRWVHLPWLLGDRVFTHRLTETELEHDVLTADPDLSLIQLYVDHPAFAATPANDDIAVTYPHASGTDGVRDLPDEARADFGSLVLPTGTLGELGARAGDLVAVSFQAGRIAVTAVDEVAVPLESARSYATEFLTGYDPVEIDDLLISLLLDVPVMFTKVLPPIRELLESWGIGHWDGLVAEPGFEWDRWRQRMAAEAMVQRYDLTGEEAAAVQVLVAYVRSVTQALDAVSEGASALGADPAALTEAEVEQLFAGSVSHGWLSAMPDSDQVDLALPYLAEPHLAKVLLAELYDFDGDPAWAGLGAAAESLRKQAGRRTRPALHWLQATAYDRLGDLAAAAEQLRAAERLDPDFYPAVVDLARLANDRGDATTALALLSRVPDEVATFLRGVLEDVRPQPTRILPRNAPCWCGSGRKFKQCHLRQPDQAPLTDRAGWLYAKGIVYALESGWGELIDLLGEVRTAGITSQRLANEAVNDGLVVDVTLFEGGALAEYVDSRQHVLPPDELLLAQQWLLTERSAYEVTGVDPGVSVTFRDLRTGDEVLSADRLASRDARVGQLVCCHLLPLPDGTHAIHSIEPIELHQRSGLIDLLDADDRDPFAIVAFLSSRLAPPTLVNTEGHPLVTQPVEHSAEERAVVADYVRDYETKWLDLDIPALDGLTPRQAAADPTRRDDLRRLLASFPETDDPTQMSPARLRQALGL